MEIPDKNIVITGGQGNLGRALARALRSHGAHVYSFDRTAEESTSFALDVTREDQVQTALQEIGRVDILINCAGEIYSEPIYNPLGKQFRRHRRESWDRVLSANLTSTFTMCSLVAELMASQRINGLMINFSSVAAQGNTGQAAYSSAKAAVEAFTRVLAKELGTLKIRAVAIAPGFIDTPSTHHALNPDTLAYWIRQTPLRRLGKVEDIVKTVLYIIDCDHITGCTVAVDGAVVL